MLFTHLGNYSLVSDTLLKSDANFLKITKKKTQKNPSVLHNMGYLSAVLFPSNLANPMTWSTTANKVNHHLIFVIYYYPRKNPNKKTWFSQTYLRSLSSRITWQSWDTQFTLRDINTTSKHRNTILAQLQSELCYLFSSKTKRTRFTRGPSSAFRTLRTILSTGPNQTNFTLQSTNI